MILQRIITTVNKITNIYLNGVLPLPIAGMNVLFNGVNYNVSGSNFNISLGTMNNPDNVSDTTVNNIVIQNNTYIAYSSQIIIAPALTAQNLTSFTTLDLPR